MSKVVTGIIQEINKKSVAGGKFAYDVTVAGKSYGYGLYPPKAKEGDYVKFDIDDSRGYENVARNSMKVSSGKPPPEVVAQNEASIPQKNSEGTSFDGRQDVISRQSARNTAVAYMNVLAVSGALAVPATKGKQMEFMDTILTKYTQEFYEGNTGLAWKDISPGQTDEVEDAPDDDTPDAETPADSEWQ